MLNFRFGHKPEMGDGREKQDKGDADKKAHKNSDQRKVRMAQNCAGYRP